MVYYRHIVYSNACCCPAPSWRHLTLTPSTTSHTQRSWQTTHESVVALSVLQLYPWLTSAVSCVSCPPLRSPCSTLSLSAPCYRLPSYLPQPLRVLSFADLDFPLLVARDLHSIDVDSLSEAHHLLPGNYSLRTWRARLTEAQRQGGQELRQINGREAAERGSCTSPASNCEVCKTSTVDGPPRLNPRSLTAK